MPDLAYPFNQNPSGKFFLTPAEGRAMAANAAARDRLTVALIRSVGRDMTRRFTPDAQIRLTIFSDLAAKTAKIWEGTTADLAARFRGTTAPHKHDLPLVSGCRFGDVPTVKDSLRHAGNIAAVCALVVEHDGGRVTLADAGASLRRAGVAGFLYETPSSTPDGPRWRAVLPLSAEHPPAAHRGLVDTAARLFGNGVLAPESWTAAQPFYFGHVAGGPNAALAVPGTPLDLADVEGDEGAAEAVGGATAGEHERDGGWAADAGTRPALPAPSLARVKSALAHLDPEPRDTWLRAGAALKVYAAETGEDAESLFIAWSRGDLRHGGPRVPASFQGEDDCRSLLASLRREDGARVTVASIIREAKRNGWRDPGEASEAAAQAQERRGIRLLAASDCSAESSPPWLIDDLLMRQAVNALSAEPGNGKSACAIDIAWHVATGRDFAGRRVRRSGVAIIVAAEDAGSLQRRLVAQVAAKGPAPDLRLAVREGGGGFDLRRADAEDARELVAVVRETLAALVVIDTFAAATPGTNENDGGEMGAAIETLHAIAATGAAVLILHHPKKSDAPDGDLRGHGSLRATCASIFCLRRDADSGIIHARTTKLRDGDPNQHLAFRIAPQRIGVTDEGEDVTAPVAWCVENDSRAAKVSRLAAQPRRALHILEELGETSRDEWRSAAMADPEFCDAESAGARRTAFSRATRALDAAGFVVTCPGGHIRAATKAASEGDVFEGAEA